MPPRASSIPLLLLCFAAAPAFAWPGLVDPDVEPYPSEWTAGALWAEPPVLSPQALEGPTPQIQDLRDAMTRGDPRAAEHIARRMVDETRWGNDRVLAAFTLGLMYRERQLHNLASEAFTQVRVSKGPLAEWGAYYEAEQDLLRGKPWVAIRECEKLEERFPKGRFSAACLRLTAQALVATGNTSRARDLAANYDMDHPFDPITEQIDLAIARRWAERHPELAIPLLRRLVTEHERPLTGRVAEELLGELHAAGHPDATIPNDVPSLQKRAISLREVKRKAEAWEAFQELRHRAEDDPQLSAWVEAEAARFAWRTHHWDDLSDLYEAQYREDSSGDNAWSWYHALDRGGRYTESLEVALEGQRAHRRTSRWRRSEEILARTAMLAGNYEVAREQFDHVIRRGGWAARRAEMYAAISAVMAEDTDNALERLDRIIKRNRGYLPNAHYWRGKTHTLRGDEELASQDFAWILEHAPLDWYAVLVRQQHTESAGPPWDRKGRWPGAFEPDWPEPELHPLLADEVPTGPLSTPIPAGLRVWEQLTWPIRAALAPAAPPSPGPASEVFYDPGVPPSSYVKSPFFDPEDAWDRLRRVARDHGEDWPEWQLVYDLARAGLYDLSGPLLSAVFEDHKKAVRNPRHKHHAAARRIGSAGADWRPLFYVARDHHHADRFTFGLWDTVSEPEHREQALRLGWPLAHDQYVWSHARDADIDPFLVMAIMRVESRYDAVAVSRVGARGAMQIMPSTGALLADLRDDEAFMTGDLEDPILSVGYGIFYLGKLVDRFDGAYPLAVASYNGGPFNVSAWLRGAGELPMDALVEHIPFRETRRYVRSVTAAYQTYVDLYGHPDDRIRLPSPSYGDDPSIVDF
ncbi:MAG: hypothetical protein EA397_10800 [Deltaproteobacteria bacterium]|nr:MAG: hypothetical protein EA397_10800 [Deltaproteobacteria bacterium]